MVILIEEDENEMIQLAAEDIITARNQIIGSNTLMQISLTANFFSTHLHRQRCLMPVSYSTIVRLKDDDDRATKAYGLYPQVANNMVIDNFDLIIGELHFVSSCDGIVGMFSQFNEKTRLRIWNPFRNISRDVAAIDQKVPDFNNVSVGFGRYSAAEYYFYLYYSSISTLQVYDFRDDTLQDHIVHPRMRLYGRTCDVTIDGTPYWRGYFLKKHEERIFFPELNPDETWNFGSIPFPDVTSIHHYRQTRLLEMNGFLAIVRFRVFGSELKYYITMRVDSEWHNLYGGTFEVNYGVNFYVTPQNKILIRGDHGNLHEQDTGFNIGHFDAVLMNHRNSLAYINRPPRHN